MADGPTVGDMMRAYAEDAVDHARSSFGIVLDYSPGSIQHVETVLERLHDELQGAAAMPSEEVVWTMCKMYGGYVGEVLRRSGGGEWCFDTQTDPTRKDICLSTGGRRIWPPIKVLKRLRVGVEDNVWHYFQILAKDWDIRQGS